MTLDDTELNQIRVTAKYLIRRIMNIDKKLDDLVKLNKIVHPELDGACAICGINPKYIKQLFQELIDEVIGEDLDTETYDHKPYQVGYETVVVRSSVINKIKSEQRQRAKELMEDK